MPRTKSERALRARRLAGVAARRRAVTIAGGEGPVLTVLRADVRGFLAAHRVVREDGKRRNDWRVTHVPTGFTCYANVVRPVSRAAALRARDFFDPENPLWAFTRPMDAMDRKVRANARRAIAAIREQPEPPEEPVTFKGTARNKLRHEQRDVEVSEEEVRGVLMSDEHARCSGECACQVEPDGTCVYGWPSVIRVVGLV